MGELKITLRDKMKDDLEWAICDFCTTIQNMSEEKCKGRGEDICKEGRTLYVQFFTILKRNL
jgi:hypothetical protein